MILNAYSIFDRKALQYHPPFWASADGSAVRNLQDLVGDPNTTVGRHPNDFVLFRIGAYDDSKGAMIPLPVLEHVIDAVALVQRQPEIFADLSGVRGPFTKPDAGTYVPNKPNGEAV